MRITIVGGGNIGTQFAVHCADKNHDVMIYTSAPELYDNHLQIVDECGNVTHEGDIQKATSDPSIAFTDRDLVIATYPANVMKQAAAAMEPYISSETIIGAVPGNGGSECVFHRLIERGNTFFLLERVPAVARIVKKGSIVRATGYRDELHLAALPKSKAEECAALISSIFDMKCIVIPGILNLTMTPSNPILHTTRLKSMFEDYQPGVTYESIPLFYEDWTDQSSELLMKCDDEVQAVCRALPEHHLNYVKSLRDHYESQTVEAMTAKISGISAFRGITAPSVEVNGRYIPDLHSRYFTADFSYGLSIIQQIARFAGVETPNIDEVMDWYQKIAVEKNSFRYADYGITDRESFDRFYLN